MFKKDQTEILELKNTISELKNSLERFSNKPDEAEESVDFNTIHLKFFSQRDKKKKEK